MSAVLPSRAAAPRSASRPAPVAGTADGLASLDPAEWDRLLPPAGAPLRHAYLRAWETTDLPGLRSCPVVAREPSSGRLVGAAPGYLYDLDIVGVRMPAMATMLRGLRRAWPELLWVRTYELGSPTPLANPFLVAPEEPRQRVIPGLIEAGVAHAEEADAQFVLVQSFASPHGPAAEQLEQRGFAPVTMLPPAIVDLPYSSFEEYLGAMRAQYRRRARQVLGRSQHLSVEHRGDFAELAGEFARLWRLIYDRATEVKREVLTPDFFAAASGLEGTSVLLVRRDDGSLVSFALLLADHPWLSFLHCGFDVEGRSDAAYFRLLYEIVRVAIEGGFQQVELGMTTLPPKLDIGAVPIPLFAWVRHRNPLVQRGIRAVAERLARSEDLAPRRVFKDPPPAARELVARRGGPGGVAQTSSRSLRPVPSPSS